MPTVGEKIKLARVYRNISQPDLGRLIGPVRSSKGRLVTLNQSKISKLENGQENVTPELLQKIEAVLRVRMDHPNWDGFFSMFRNGAAPH